jgi:hypothetical protein
VEPKQNPCLKEQHTFADFLYWTLVLAVPLVTAAVAMFRASVVWFVVYLIVGAGLVVVVMRTFCSHCPHYTTGGGTLRCMFFWGVPKLFQGRPVPLTWWEKGLTLAAAGVLLLLPVPALLEQPALLAVYVLSLGVFLVSVRRYECVRCTYRACPSNRAPSGGESGFTS